MGVSFHTSLNCEWRCDSIALVKMGWMTLPEIIREAAMRLIKALLGQWFFAGYSGAPRNATAWASYLID